MAAEVGDARLQVAADRKVVSVAGLARRRRFQRKCQGGGVVFFGVHAGKVILRIADVVFLQQRPVRMFSRSVVLYFSHLALEDLSESLQQERE